MGVGDFLFLENFLTSLEFFTVLQPINHLRVAVPFTTDNLYTLSGDQAQNGQQIYDI